MKLESITLLGLTTAKRGCLIVCDCEKGLLKFTDDGVKILASHVHGSEIKFADDVIEASDDSVYFSVASTKFQLHTWNLDLLEAKPRDQLLKYDLATSILVDSLYFANDVALSKDEDFLLVCESWRCLTLWLKGESKGNTKILIENLLGAPDNINLALEDSFWIALLPVMKTFISTMKNTPPLKNVKKLMIRSFGCRWFPREQSLCTPLGH